MKTLLKLALMAICGVSFAQTNLLDTSTWTVGTGSVTGFNKYGTDPENVREMATGPHGTSVLLWKGVPDAVNSTAGGFGTDYHSIDHTKTYRFSVWVKKTNSQDGAIYFGTLVRDVAASSAVNYLGGGAIVNPYFTALDLPALGEWYLLVGYVRQSGETSTVDLGGLYEKVNGTKVSATQDFKFQSSATELMLRVFLSGNTNTSDRVYFYDPAIYAVDGSEPTIQAIIDGPGGGDTQAPTAPTLSSTGKTDTTVDLSWSAATDNTAVTGYKVFKDAVLEATLGAVTTYQVTGLTASTAYQFTVTALDAAANESVASNALSVTTNSAPDTQAPTAPTLSSTGKADTTVDLSWSGATDNTAVTGYKVFKDAVLEATLGAVTTYQVTGLTASTAYQFTVTALDAATNESVASNALSVTTNAASGGGSGNWTLNGSDLNYTAGNVAIGTGTIPSNYKLAVNGKVISEEVKVQLQSQWPDYVFDDDYNLPTLQEIQDHIEEHGHLPNIPSAAEVKSNGIELGEMNRQLLEKIEELVRYTLQQEVKIKKLQQLEKRIIALEQKNKD